MLPNQANARNAREQPLKKWALIGFSIYPNDPGFRLEVKAGDIAKLLE